MIKQHFVTANKIVPDSHAADYDDVFIIIISNNISSAFIICIIYTGIILFDLLSVCLFSVSFCHIPSR